MCLFKVSHQRQNGNLFIQKSQFSYLSLAEKLFLEAVMVPQMKLPTGLKSIRRIFTKIKLRCSRIFLIYVGFVLGFCLITNLWEECTQFIKMDITERDYYLKRGTRKKPGSL